MKKLLFICLLALDAIIYSSPNCFGYYGPRFRRDSLEKVECNCPCQNYIRAGHVDGYKCLTCGHKLIPREINTSQVSAVILKSLDKLKLEKTDEKLKDKINF